MYKKHGFDSKNDLIIGPDSIPIDDKNGDYLTIYPKDKGKCLPPSCFCEIGELIRNGGFEIPGVEPGQVFSDWRLGLSSESINISMTFENVYEGDSAASIQTTATPTPESKLLQLRQNIIVTPGCLYRLKFAERLVALGNIDTVLPVLVARIFYVYQGFEYDLLNKPIKKSQIDTKYNLHREEARVPVPCNVSGVVVQFEFFITDSGGSVWNLDAVSLRAVSKTSACCCKE
jgi:hypothetical protein